MKLIDGRVRFESREDLPLTAISLAGTAWNRTGSWKFLEPLYKNLTPPCSHACLTSMDVVAMMRAVEEGDWDRAAQVAMEVNPFPSITGRLCSRPCEQPCNRKAYGGAVSVRAIERAVGDHKLRARVRPALPPVVHGRVHVVGSGPAGLSAAVALRRLGHAVTVLSTSKEPGGSLLRRVGAFRLPPEVVRDEIEWTKSLGIAFESSRRLSRADVDGLGPAVVAVGPGRPRTIPVPGADGQGIHEASALLDAIRVGDVAFVGTSAAIIGGGALAIEVARSLRRLGSQAVVMHRGTARDLAPLRADVEDAKAEGVQFEFETAPSRVERTASGSLRLSVIGTKPGGPAVTTTYEVDAVVAALGSDLDAALVAPAREAGDGPLVPGVVRLTDRLVAAGACAGLPDTGGAGVAEMIRCGRVAAHALHSALVHRDVPPAAPLADRGSDPNVAKFKDLNLAWFSREAPHTPASLDVGARIASFRPVEGDLATGASRAESARCFKCGTCVECDICFQFCPDVAIAKNAEGGYPRYSIDLSHCKGCGVCVEECPRSAIHLRKST